MEKTFNPDNKVLERMIFSLYENRAVKKTQLQLASKLRWDLFSKYWEWMIHEQYIKCENPTEGNNDFVLTTEGIEMADQFLKYFDHINKNMKTQNFR